MGILGLYGKKDKNTNKVNKANIIGKVLDKFNKKLELMLSSGQSQDYVWKAAQKYGIEWNDLSDSLKDKLDKFKPEVKKAAPKSSKKKPVAEKAVEEKAEEKVSEVTESSES